MWCAWSRSSEPRKPISLWRRDVVSKRHVSSWDGPDTCFWNVSVYNTIQYNISLITMLTCRMRSWDGPDTCFWNVSVYNTIQYNISLITMLTCRMRSWDGPDTCFWNVSVYNTIQYNISLITMLTCRMRSWALNVSCTSEVCKYRLQIEYYCNRRLPVGKLANIFALLYTTAVCGNCGYLSSSPCLATSYYEPTTNPKRANCQDKK